MSKLPETQKTALQRLADVVAEAQLLPDEATTSVVRDALIDTLGCILIGARQPVAKRTQAALSSWGTGLAPVLGTELCLPAPWAAMANAVAGHALEFDDWEIPGNTHPSGVLFPALLAVAAGQPISGRQIVEAYIAGFEVIARIGEAVNYEHYANGWHATATLGAIGSAAAVARLKALDAEQTAAAMSISVSQAIGFTCQFGSNTKPLQAGFAAKAGLLAATLAEKRLTGQVDVLEHPKGFNALMGHADAERFAKRFNISAGRLAISEYGLVIKPYPTCGYTHRIIDCALELHPILKNCIYEIKRITISLIDYHAAILPFKQPNNRAEALFSLPFCASLALIRGQVSMEQIESGVWHDPDIVHLIAHVTLLLRQAKNPALNFDADDPDWLEVEMKDGTRYRSEVAFPLGTPQNSMTREQIMQKFLSNARFGESELARKEAAITALKNWDTVADINQVISHFGVIE